MSETLKKIARKHKPVKLYLRSFLEKYEQLFKPNWLKNGKLQLSGLEAEFQKPGD